jgi:hypothetical protein
MLHAEAQGAQGREKLSEVNAADHPVVRISRN